MHKKVFEARVKEVTFVDNKMVWIKLTRTEAKRRGLKVVKGRWIDINKGDDLNPLLRSRYVGKEFNDGPLNGLFAGTPPLEGLRSMASEASTIDDPEDEEKVIELDDVPELSLKPKPRGRFASNFQRKQ